MSRRRVARSAQQSGDRKALSPDTGVWWRLGLIVLAGCLTYSNSLSGPFAFDDQLSIVNSPEIRDLSNLERVLSPEKESPVAGRPLVSLSFAVNYAMGGLEVRGYHLWNIALHLICGVLLFGIVRRTLELITGPAEAGHYRNRPAKAGRHLHLAFATALIWTLHPLNTEAVNYVTQRTELMMALFYLLTLYAAIRAIRSRRVHAWEALAVMSCGLGMACKESMVTAPLMVVLYDRVFAFDSFRESFRARWRLYGGLSLTWLLLAYLMLPGPRSNSVGFSTGIDPWAYLLNQTVMITQYLRLSIWPARLVANYGWPVSLTLADVLPQALLITFLLVATVIALIRWPGLGFLGAWFFVTLAPVSSIVPIATEVGAERRMYLPLAALIVLAAIGGARQWQSLGGSTRGSALPLAKRSSAPAKGSENAPVGAFSAEQDPPYVLHETRRRPSPVLCPSTRSGHPELVEGWTRRHGVLIVVSIALAVGTIVRNREYQSALSLAQTTLERWPTPVASQMVGIELSNLGRDEEAIKYLSESAKTHSRARYHLGIALNKTGKLDEAVEQFQMFARQEPLLVEVIAARLYIGQVRMVRQRWSDAANEFKLVLSMSPSHVQARRLLADAVFRQEKYEEAIGLYREYLRLRPSDEGALANLGIALVATEKFDEALAVFRRAVEAEPQSRGAHLNLAEALLDSRDPAGAAVEARQVVALSPDTPEGYDVLGRALALQGQTDAAIAQFERALQIDPGNAAARDHLTRLLKAMGR